MTSLTREKLEAVRKLFEVSTDIEHDDETMLGPFLMRFLPEFFPTDTEHDDETMLDVEETLRKPSGEYLVPSPSYWFLGERQALPVGDIRRPERGPTC